MSDTALPYDGTEGYAGSQTSKDRAVSDVVTGTASKRQRYVLILAAQAKERGITVAELRDASLHHGRVSGTLSVLHKVGKLMRLSEARGRCAIYVLPEYVNGRATSPHGVVHRADKETLAAADLVAERIKPAEDRDALFDIPADDEEYIAALRMLIDYAHGRR